MGEKNRNLINYLKNELNITEFIEEVLTNNDILDYANILISKHM